MSRVESRRCGGMRSVEQREEHRLRALRHHAVVAGPDDEWGVALQPRIATSHPGQIDQRRGWTLKIDDRSSVCDGVPRQVCVRMQIRSADDCRTARRLP